MDNLNDAYDVRLTCESTTVLLVTEPTVPALLNAVERLRNEALRARLVQNALLAVDERSASGRFLRSHLESN